MKKSKPPGPKTDDSPTPHKPGYGKTIAISPKDNEYLIKGKEYPILDKSKRGFFINVGVETIFCLYEDCFHVHPYQWVLKNI